MNETSAHTQAPDSEQRMQPDDYDLGAFEDGKRAGYALGRRHAEREAFQTVLALLRASGGRIVVPIRYVEDTHGWVLRRWENVGDNTITFSADKGSVDGD